jgi:hypothetical protein
MRIALDVDSDGNVLPEAAIQRGKHVAVSE